MGNSSTRQYEMHLLCLRGVPIDRTKSFGPEFRTDYTMQIQTDAGIWKCSRPYNDDAELEKDSKLAEENYPHSIVVVDSMNHILTGKGVRKQLHDYDQGISAHTS